MQKAGLVVVIERVNNILFKNGLHCWFTVTALKYIKAQGLIWLLVPTTSFPQCFPENS